MAEAHGPRRRLLEAAKELTYNEGVAVGTEAILREASVARNSLYQHFGGKAGLIAAVLRESADDDIHRYREKLAAGGDDPRRRILAVLGWLEEVTDRPAFRGCRYASAELALPAADHPAHAVIHAYASQLHGLFEEELATLGHPDPPQAATQIVTIIHGALATALLQPETQPVCALRPVIEQILSTPSRRIRRTSPSDAKQRAENE
jgi:AcrR family transcriptional regulator